MAIINGTSGKNDFEFGTAAGNTIDLSVERTGVLVAPGRISSPGPPATTSCSVTMPKTTA